MFCVRLPHADALRNFAPLREKIYSYVKNHFTHSHRICSACFCENLRCLRETITLRMVLCLPWILCETMPPPQGISENSCPFVAQKIPVDTRRYVEKSLYSVVILFPRLVILFPRHGILVTRYGICITKAWYFYYWHRNKFWQ